jgi:hypothetical protein
VTTTTTEPPTTTTTEAPAPEAPPVAQIIRTVTSDLPRRTAFPVALVLFAVGFLAVQGRLDRRDPKLASAPLRADEGLAFEAPPSRQGAS